MTRRVSPKSIIREAAIILLSLLVIFTVVKAGPLSPSASPAATSYTLQDIYTRLITNASATAGNHDLNATTTPGATFPTLTSIYNAIPTIYAGDLLASSTYLGVTRTVAVTPGPPPPSSPRHHNQKNSPSPRPWLLRRLRHRLHHQHGFCGEQHSNSVPIFSASWGPLLRHQRSEEHTSELQSQFHL